MSDFVTQYTGRYKISKHRFLAVYYYILDMYPAWVAEYNAIQDNRKSYQYGDKEGGKTQNDDPTQKTALRLAHLSKKIDMVKDAAEQAGGDLAPWIIQAATTERCGYNTLRMQADQIPCGKNEYYAARRKFYWIMSKKLK